MNERGAELSIVGKELPSIDSKPKATGEAQYIEDLRIAGMLYGKILRSPIPHGRILHIDTSRAKRLVGVKSVVTAQDTPTIKFGLVISDELILAGEKVRYVGDEVAAVAAIDLETAEEALSLIRVDYEELPPVFDPEEAMKPGAPLIHEVEKNIAQEIRFTRGTFAEGLKSADLIAQERFETPFVHPSYIEPVGCVAFFDLYGTLNLWLPFQKIFLTRALLAKALNMPPGKIRIIQPSVGGGFGGKLDQKIPAVASLLTMTCQKPVKIINTREDEFRVGRSRVGTQIDLTMGMKKDGTVVAKRARIIADNGAYSSYAPSTLNTLAIRQDNAYRFHHLETEAYLVYTNKVPTGAFRGFGNPQVTFAVESMLDILAAKAGLDPLEVRRRNVSMTGDVTVHGWRIASGGLPECLERAAQAMRWKEKKRMKAPHRGLGMACLIHVSGNRASYDYDGSSAFIRLNEDGNFDLLIGEGELGQGARTVFAQIAAEELGVHIENINVSVADTATTPYCLGASASRVTFVGGNAVKAAAQAVREKMVEVASDMLEAPKKQIVMEDGTIFAQGSRDKYSLGELAKFALYRKGGAPIMEKGTFDANSERMDPKTKYGNISGAYPFGVHMAEVEVDEETGKVKILAYVAAHDLGRAINPMAARGQIIGGVAQGIGYALTEELVFERGHIVNSSFTDYKIISAEDMPPVTTILVETLDPSGPFGAKGLGEPTIVPVAPAIANAIYDALGVRMKSLPITPEKILKALENLTIPLG